MRTILLSFLALLWVNAAHGELIVHEWGTFTSLQDEDGNAVPGINTDDEPVPDFVHDLSRRLLIPPTEAPPSFFQGAPSCHPDVTMRLETPVLYFHRADQSNEPVTVKAEFHGGWLTQYFPDAIAVAPGIEADGSFGRLEPDAVGGLEWKNLKFGASKADFPKTDAHVWLAPRRVDAVAVAAPGGESEQFLFYRGVANRDAPVRVVRSEGRLAIEEREKLDVDRFWLVDVRADGAMAFRHFAADGTAPATFESSDYTQENGRLLREELHEALVGAGLFADESNALLETWKLSYFESSGLRVFFLVPQVWTDRLLPLTISGDPPTTRVMVGRVELVTPEQRRLLQAISEKPVPRSWEDLRLPLERLTLRADDPGRWNKLMAGKIGFEEAGVEVPESFRDYLKLGRFRNALVLDEQRRRPTENLAAFIREFRLEGYQP